MVLTEPTESQFVEGFYWFATPDEIFEEEVEGRSKPVKKLRINFSSPRWVPTNRSDAYRWFYKSPNAAALRSAAPMYLLCRITNTRFENTLRGMDGEEKPEDWEYLEIPDATNKYDFDEMGEGQVIEGPLDHVFSVRTEEGWEVFSGVAALKGISSGIMSPREIIELGGDRVIRHSDSLEYQTGEPIFGGPSDIRLGTLFAEERCATCGLTGNPKDAHQCPGHFGRIPLEVPVPNFLFLSGNIDQSPLIRTLRYTCLNCSRVTLSEDLLKVLADKARVIMYEKGQTSPEGYALILDNFIQAYNEYYAERGPNSPYGPSPYQLATGNSITPISTKVNHCPHCNEYSPQLLFKTRYGMGKILKFFPRPGKRDKDVFPMTLEYDYGTVYNALKGMPNEDALVLGFNTKIDSMAGEPKAHPSYMFFEELPVAPNNIRPPQTSPSGALTPNDLTVLYENVIRANNRLRERAQDRPNEVRRLEAILFSAVTQLVSTETPLGTPETKQVFGGSGTTTTALQGLYDRIKGSDKNKVRRQLQSKITEHVMYSVIVPNTALRLDEVGVPIYACMEMTVAEEVTEENLEEMKELVIRGSPSKPKFGNNTAEEIAHHYPGAGAVKRFGPQKRVIELREDAFDPFTVDYKNDWRLRERYPDDASKRIFNVEEDLLGAEWYPERRRLRSIHKDNNSFKKALDAFTADFKREYARNQRAIVAETLKPGDIVHRHLVKGDTILFTRAPALHRQNVMAGKVIPMKQRAFSFNPTICVPFNADYDGDTMRCFVPQSQEAIEEAKEIMGVNKQIIHSRYGRPTIASDQDETSGAYLLTYPNMDKAGTYSESLGIGYKDDGTVYFNKKRVALIMSSVFTRDDDSNLVYHTQLPDPDFGKFYTGRGLVSHFIPQGINCIWEAVDKSTCEIRNGEFIRGTLDKKGVANGSMVLAPAFIYRFGYELGIAELAKFIDHVNRLFFSAHLNVGYTIGIEDISLIMRYCYIDGDSVIPDRLATDEQKKALEKVPVNDIIDGWYETVNEELRTINEAFFNRTLHELPDKYFKDKSRHWLTYDPLQWAELVMNDITQDYDKKVLALTKEMQGTSNAMNIAVVSGARANDGSIQQMSGSHSQVTVGGRRIVAGTEIGRLFPHIQKGDYSGASFGFVKSSYAEGLEPMEFFSASMAGRRSMINKGSGAIQKSGYLEHVLKRAAENLMIDKRGYLVDLRSKKVVSHAIGGDNLRPFHPRGPGNKEGISLELQPLFLEYECVHAISLHDTCQLCKGGSPPRKVGNFVKLPPTVQSQIEEKFREREVANPLEVIASALRYYLDNKVTPGEMVGSTGAANTGEPVTQAGLRAFHGGGKGNVPTVERVEQLLKLSRSAIQQPQTVFYLKNEYNTEEYAQKIANFCSRLYLKDVVKLFSYDTEGLAITLTFNDSVVETFEVDTGFIAEYLAYRGKNSTYPYSVVQEQEGLRVQFNVLPDVMSATAFLLLMKETLELYQINGLMNAGRAFTEYQRHPAKDEPQWSVIVLGPETPTIDNRDTMMADAESLIGQYVDLDLTRTNNPFHILYDYGIEAALACIKELFWEQMNGVNEKDRQTVKGMGELDYRYIDALVDNMGITGVLHGLGRSGQMVATVTSLLGGIGGEDPGMSLRAHTLMGTYDELGGMVEAISAGKLPTLGRAYIKENEDSE